MTGALGSLLTFLLLYKYVALIAIVFLGSIALPLPVALVLVASGAFAAQGYFDFWQLLVVSSVTNIAADVGEFLLAKRYGLSVFSFLRIKHSTGVTATERYVRDHRRATIFLTRFSGTTGALANVFAGVARMSLPVFVTFDSLGNIVSIVPYIALGWVVGANWQAWIPFVDLSGWVIAIAACALLSLLWILQRRKKRSHH